MELALILAQQVLVMFTLILTGVLFVKVGKMDQTGIGYLTNILLYLVSPCLLINSYQIAFDRVRFGGLLIAMGLSVLSHLISIGVNRYLLLRDRSGREKIGVERFAAIYSNAGYMAIPLIDATFGAEGVFYSTAYLTVFNLFMWTHGAAELSRRGRGGEKGKRNWKSAVINPGVLGCIAGFLLFILQIQLPTPIGPAISYAASMNTPLALFVSGALLANIDLKRALKNVRIYWVGLVRILLIPLIVLGIFLLLRVSSWAENTGFIAVICMISTACPTAQAAGFFAYKNGADGEYGGQIMAFTTVLSILTLPAMAALSAAVLM